MFYSQRRKTAIRLNMSTLFDRSESRSEEWTRNNLTALPDYEEGDKFLEFYIHGGNVRGFFQFRDDAVVNHNNGRFQGPYSLVQHDDDYAPNVLLRFGALPVYIATILLSGTVALCVARFR